MKKFIIGICLLVGLVGSIYTGMIWLCWFWFCVFIGGCMIGEAIEKCVLR